jgi:hypothetical protein
MELSMYYLYYVALEEGMLPQLPLKQMQQQGEINSLPWYLIKQEAEIRAHSTLETVGAQTWGGYLYGGIVLSVHGWAIP